MTVVLEGRVSAGSDVAHDPWEITEDGTGYLALFFQDPVFFIPIGSQVLFERVPTRPLWAQNVRLRQSVERLVAKAVGEGAIPIPVSTGAIEKLRRFVIARIPSHPPQGGDYASLYDAQLELLNEDMQSIYDCACGDGGRLLVRHIP